MANNLRTIAKIMMALIWIIAGVMKFKEPQGTIDNMVTSLAHFDDWLVKDIETDPFLYRNFLENHASAIVYLLGVVELICGALLIVGSNLASFTLAMLVAGFTVIVHNPLYSHLDYHERMLEAQL